MGENQTYELALYMNPNTVGGLTESGFSLLGLMGAQTLAPKSVPVLTFVSRDYTAVNTFLWTDHWEAYTSNSPITPGSQVIPEQTVKINIGQTWQVRSDGSGPVINQGALEVISILNTTDQELVCGIALNNENVLLPICASPLFSMFTDFFAPFARVLLMFSPVPLTPWTVITQAVSEAVLIDFIGDSSSQTVNFDLDTGWTWGGNVSAQTVPVNADLIPLLLPTPYEVGKKAL